MKNNFSYILHIKKIVSVFLLVCFVFYSCKQQSETNKKSVETTPTNIVVEEPLAEEIIDQKTDAIVPVFEVDLDTILKKWTLLTTVDHKKVVFQPCDAGIDKFEIKKNDANAWVIYIYSGQEFVIFNIESISQVKNQINFLLVDQYDASGTIEYILFDYNSNKKTAKWKSHFENQEFVNENGIDDYEVYNEPCKDCFDECPD